MAEARDSVRPEVRAGEGAAYRPVSGLAVASAARSWQWFDHRMHPAASGPAADPYCKEESRQRPKGSARCRAAPCSGARSSTT